MKALIVVLLVCASAMAQSSTKMNGLELRKGQELQRTLQVHSARVKSEQARVAHLQSVKGGSKAQLTEAQKRLANAQRNQANAQSSLTSWEAKVLATHGAKNKGKHVNWANGQIQ